MRLADHEASLYLAQWDLSHLVLFLGVACSSSSRSRRKRRHAWNPLRARTRAEAPIDRTDGSLVECDEAKFIVGYPCRAGVRLRTWTFYTPKKQRRNCRSPG